MLAERLKEKKLSVYRCSKLSGVPYSTLSEMVRGKTKLGSCSAETVYRIAKALDTTVEALLNESAEFRSAFETFKSNVCHRVRTLGDLDFIIETLHTEEIRTLWEKKWYPEAFYLLAMTDYLSRENALPLCENYNDIRACTLPEPLFPRDVVLLASMNEELDVKQQCLKEAIPEFLRFNIVESEIRNVC